MKNKILTVILLTATTISLVSCASRKYGCPATTKITKPVVDNKA